MNAPAGPPVADALLSPGLQPVGTPTRFYVVRHGETDWNRTNRIQGHTDTPLNDRGLHQARLVAAHLAGCRLDVIYSSDLQRARGTAVLVAEACNLPVETDAALRERDFGPLSGRGFAEVAHLRNTTVRTEADPTEWAGVEGVETDQAIAARVWGFVRPLAERHAGRRVLLVTHGGVLRVLMCGVLGLEGGRPWRAVLKNAAVNVFEVFDGVWRLRTFGLELEPD